MAREGSQAPGTPAGANFDTFNNPVLNASGKTAFTATLQATGGGVTSGNDFGLWAEDPLGVLTLVVREGDAFTLAPGDVRTISAISFNSLNSTVSGGEDGRGISFNDDFTLAFGLTFTTASGGGSGIFTSQIVPEPAGLSLLAIAGVGAATLRRRRRRTRRDRAGFISPVWGNRKGAGATKR